MGTYPIMHINHSHGRSEGIRTPDPCIPNALRYQAALHSDGQRRGDRTLTSKTAEFESAPYASSEQPLKMVHDERFELSYLVEGQRILSPPRLPVAPVMHKLRASQVF